MNKLLPNYSLCKYADPQMLYTSLFLFINVHNYYYIVGIVIYVYVSPYTDGPRYTNWNLIVYFDDISKPNRMWF